METYGVLPPALAQRAFLLRLSFWQGGQFLGGKPAAVAATELYLVAIFCGLHRAQDRLKIGQLYFPDAMQLVVNLLLLGLELLLVGQVLPLATTANAEMLAKGNRSHLAHLHKAGHPGLTILMLALGNLQIHHVTWHAERNKHGHVIHMGDTFPLGGNRLYGDILEQRQGFLFAHGFT